MPTSKPKVTEYNCATAETITREMNDLELADWTKASKEVADAQLKIQAQNEAKTSAQAKLAALGLTPDEVAAILGNQPKRVASI